jgi:probable phosphoglycerate mutase
MRIIFVRHGEPDYDNDCLTARGVEQAKKTAARLNNEDIGAVFASPMGRAVETASYTAKDHDKEVNILDFMHEIDWGAKTGKELEYDGHPWTLAYELIAAGQIDNWKEHHFFKDNICMDYYDRLSREADRFLEGYGLVREGNIYRADKENNDTIAIFAHGGSGAVILSHILNLPFPYVLTAMPYGVCSVTILNLTPLNGDMVIPRIELFNDMNHLGEVRKETLRFEK